MNTAPDFVTEPRRADWLCCAADTACRERVWALGQLTGLRVDFTPANFERALVLDRLIELRRPARILEIGTGRGLGCLGMAESARIHSVAARIVTLDLLDADTPQRWPIEVAGKREVLRASRREVWGRHIDPALIDRVQEIAGPTTRTLPRLAAGGHKFDLIFIDAGHDLYSVVHDLAYSVRLLAPGGAILMDDFAPMEEFGLGTCIAAQHARRFFGSVEIFPTEGLVFGGAAHPEAPRGMVLLTDPLAGEVAVSRVRLLAWRFAEVVVRICHLPGFFPLRAARPRSRGALAPC
jgi:predicted O-methyltransferase YrrM